MDNQLSYKKNYATALKYKQMSCKNISLDMKSVFFESCPNFF